MGLCLQHIGRTTPNLKYEAQCKRYRFKEAGYVTDSSTRLTYTVPALFYKHIRR